jgi:hypothetical protein
MSPVLFAYVNQESALFVALTERHGKSPFAHSAKSLNYSLCAWLSPFGRRGRQQAAHSKALVARH